MNQNPEKLKESENVKETVWGLIETPALSLNKQNTIILTSVISRRYFVRVVITHPRWIQPLLLLARIYYFERVCYLLLENTESFKIILIAIV